jgi:hypothetical protein
MLGFQIDEDGIYILGFPYVPEEEIYITNDGSIDVREPEYFDSMFLALTEMQLLETIHLEGFGDHLSGCIVELTSMPSVNRSQIDQIMDFIKEYYPDNRINWSETLNYLEGYK